MIRAASLKFLEDLKVNNNKSWFDNNRKRYEDAKSDLITLIENWKKGFGPIDLDIANIDARKSIFRINRDIRFSNNKDPYKTNMGGFLSKGGKNTGLPGYYLHIEPGKCFFAAGLYQPEGTGLEKIRQEIDYNFEEFKKIVENPEFVKIYGKLDTEHSLKKNPKGYDSDNPAIEYLKLKSFICFTKIDDKLVVSDNLTEKIIHYSKVAKPLNDFMKRAVSE